MWIALLAIAIIAAGTRAAAGSAPLALLPLDVLLTVSPDLSRVSQRALVTEAERIWQSERVNLRWLPALAGADDPSVPLRVLVITRQNVAASDNDQWPVGELVAPAGYRALAIASISGAQRVVSEATRYQLLELPALAEQRLGLVLGRAVAHEIGHFLLATRTHADRGLMRASIGAREFADPAAGTFGLDSDAGRWLRQQLLLDRMPAVGELRAAGFSYQRR